MHKKLSIQVFIYTLLLFTALSSSANNNYILSGDSLSKIDTTKKVVVTTDTVVESGNSTDLDAKVDYAAEDSMLLDVETQKLYLYGKANVNYETSELKSQLIELRLKENTAFAKGLPDSTGRVIGTPVFTDGENKFEANTITYNFQTKKGKITDILTQEGEGYIHGKTVKKDNSNQFYIQDGKYTTCNNKLHPHFYFNASKLKVIQNDKIVAGPVDMYIMDIPTPLALPFGIFPNKKGRKSGFMMPFPGNSANNGFFMKDGGYYWGISDKIDLSTHADIYSKGSWAVRELSTYNNRYHYQGNVNVGYSIFKNGYKEDKVNYNEQKLFFVRWSHTQDTKARPNSRFSANVNFGSSKYNQLNSLNAQNVLNNNFNSNISFQKTFPNTPFNMTASLRQSQNNQTRDVDFTLPQVTFNMTRIYPFKRKVQIGSARWYENIGVSYTGDMQNLIKTKDTLMFRKSTYQHMNNGLKHTAAVSTNLKVLKYFTLTPFFNYNERWYLQSIKKTTISGRTKDGERDSTYIVTDTIKGFKTDRDFNTGANLTTKIYGMYMFKKGPIQGIRHMITPSVGFTYTPAMGNMIFGRYGSTTPEGRVTGGSYSPLQQGIYGFASPKRIGNINFSIMNTLEMKVRSKKDTVTGFKKVKIFDGYTVSSSYNIFADSLKWTPISMNMWTTFLKNFNVNFRSNFDPYVKDSLTGRRLNKFELDKNNRLARFSNANLAINFTMRSKQKTGNKTKAQSLTNVNQAEMKMIQSMPNAYIDFNIPWTLSASYSLNYNNDVLPLAGFVTQTVKVTQALSLNGDLSVTTNTKIAFTSGYDFVHNKLTYTNLHIIRDLHCWELRFNWVPIGPLRSYSLDIQVKASTLQDLKLSRKRSWYDLQ